MKLGISGQALENVKSLKEIINIGKKYDITNFEIWPRNISKDEHYPVEAIKEAKKILDNEGACACCVTTDAGFIPEICNDDKKFADNFKKTIEAAAVLDAKVINHYCFNLNMAQEHDFKKLEGYWLEPLCSARKLGITLVLENEAHDGTRTPQDMLKIMQHFNNQYFKTNLDVTNYYHASCEAFPNAYDVLKPWIGYIHIKNAKNLNSGNVEEYMKVGDPMSGYMYPTPILYTPIPEGSVNIPGLLSAVETDGEYNGVCTLEPHVAPEFVEHYYRTESEWLYKLGYFKSNKEA